MQHGDPVRPTNFGLPFRCALGAECVLRRQGSAAFDGCPGESGARGPAIRYAVPPRPPERSRGTTGRPALCPFDAGAAHLAAAAPKRARRPGALHPSELPMPAKRLPLRDWAPNSYGRCFLSSLQGPSTDFRRGCKA
eukprot:COSAG04_NODE_7466_length_1123_cov_4.503906_2_plen_137_part_00